jgi:PIN domain nuclease of toxin-antitoxin system
MIVLDTHAWIWFSGDDRFLSAAALDAARGADRIGVSPISVWEVLSNPAAA